MDGVEYTSQGFATVHALLHWDLLVFYPGKKMSQQPSSLEQDPETSKLTKIISPSTLKNMGIISKNLKANATFHLQNRYFYSVGNARQEAWISLAVGELEGHELH